MSNLEIYIEALESLQVCEHDATLPLAVTNNFYNLYLVTSEWRGTS